MIAFPAGMKVWIAGGVTDMRRGMNTQCSEGGSAILKLAAEQLHSARHTESRPYRG